MRPATGGVHLGYPGPQGERTQIRSSAIQGPAFIDNHAATLTFVRARRTLAIKRGLVQRPERQRTSEPSLGGTDVNGTRTTTTHNRSGQEPTKQDDAQASPLVGSFRWRPRGNRTMDTEFLPFRSAADRLQVSQELLRRRVKAGELATFSDPLDSRKRLVRIADVDRLRQPRPIRLASVGPGDAAA